MFRSIMLNENIFLYVCIVYIHTCILLVNIIRFSFL